MTDPIVYLVILAGLFLLGAVGEISFRKTQIPDVVWLIGAGVVLRVSGFVDPQQLEPILPLFAALTLIIVLFDGGSQLVINQLVKAAPRASVMAVLGFISTTLVIAAITMLAAWSGLLHNWTFLKGLMVGAMLGGSSSLVIMPSMQVAKVEEKVSNLVGLESALTDSLCIVLAVSLIDIIMSGHASAADSAIVLAKNFGLALLIGAAAGWAWMPVLRLLRGSTHAYPVTIAALILLYVAVESFGGSPAMAILTFAVIVGNADALMKKLGFSAGQHPLQLDDSVRIVHSQMSFIIKSFFFTYIGLMLGPPWSLLILGVVIGIGLLAARIPVVMALTGGGEFTTRQRKLITVSLPRGMAAGVLATIPTMRGMEGMENLPPLVFSAVVTSIFIFAGGFKKVRGEPVPAPESTHTSEEDLSASPPQNPPVATEPTEPVHPPSPDAPTPQDTPTPSVEPTPSASPPT